MCDLNLGNGKRVQGSVGGKKQQQKKVRGCRMYDARK